MTPLRSAWSRRRLLVGSTALAASLAGCTRVDEFLADYVFGQVNVFNTTDEQIDGSLRVTDPNGTAVIDDRLVLGPSDAPDDAEIEDRDPELFYEDVFTDAGDYQLDLSVDATDTTPPRETNDQFQIADPSEDRLFVFIGDELTGSFLTVAAVQDIDELERVLESRS